MSKMLSESGVLVTEGASFVKGHLVDRLTEEGCGVVVLDNFLRGKNKICAHTSSYLALFGYVLAVDALGGTGD